MTGLGFRIRMIAAGLAHRWVIVNRAGETVVQTATGECILRQSESGVLLTNDGDAAPIIPLGELVAQGGVIDWRPGQCRLHHPRAGTLKVTVVANCPEEEKKKIHGVVKALVHGGGGLHAQGYMLDMNMLKEKFPAAPLEQLARLAIRPGIKSTEIAWNRRMRRSIEKADHVVLNLFCGPESSWWSKRGPLRWVMVNVDILQNQDLLNDSNMAYLTDVARSGKVKTFLAGPPCRSVSVLRLREDGGPRQVRDREGPRRWGKGNLKPHEQTLVDTDNQLLLRTLVLAELRESANPGETEFMVETPEDPAKYREGENIPTFTVWPEVTQVLEKDLKLKRISVDQGALGHVRKKPTCLWASIPEVKQLDGLRGNRSSTSWPTHVDQALVESKSLAAWAVGLKQAVVGSWQRVASSAQPRVKTVRDDTNWAWYQHILNGQVSPWCWKRSPTTPTAVSKCLHDGGGRFDQDMGQPRYFLVATVTVPVRHDKPLIWGWKPDDSVEDIEEGAEHVFQDRQEILPEGQDPNPFKGDGEEAVVCEEEVKLTSFEQQIAELKDVGVKRLTLAAPLLNRKEATVIAATSKLFARYRALQVPVFRIKTDRAKEFVSKRFREWTLLHCWG